MPEYIRVKCYCGKSYNADPAHGGREIACSCGRRVRIPIVPPSDPPRKSSGGARSGAGSAGSGPGASGSGKPPGGHAARPRTRINWRAALLAPWQRLSRWWRDRAHTVPLVRIPEPIARWVPALAWGYLAAAVLGVVAIWGLGDRWVWPTALLYGPRWVLLAPALPVALVVLLIRPRFRLLAAVGAGALLVVGPVMGWRTGWRQLVGAGGGELRIVTFNMMGQANPLAGEVAGRLLELDPDLVVVQECTLPIRQDQAAIPGWVARRDGGLCLISRFPIRDAVEMETVETRNQGGTGYAMWYRLEGPGGGLNLVNLHLETPGKGLERLRYLGEDEPMARNILLRDAGSARTSRWVRSQAAGEPLLIAGDFNLTVESAIYQSHWAWCANAFSRVGRGFGYTRLLKRFSARIDQVLSCGGRWEVVGARVGPDLGSDHLPLIVDLRRSE